MIAAGDKLVLRRALRSARHTHVMGLSAIQRATLQSQLADHALPHILRRNPNVIASYAAYGEEIDPGPLEARLIAAGCQIAFPRVDATGGPLTFHACGFTALIPGFRGIAEPPPGAARLIPDIVFLPLLAADPAGTRLGQGAGHYDRTLAALPAWRIGLGWDVQWQPQLPADSWDIPLDAFVAPGGWHDCAAPQQR